MKVNKFIFTHLLGRHGKSTNVELIGTRLHPRLSIRPFAHPDRSGGAPEPLEGLRSLLICLFAHLLILPGCGDKQIHISVQTQPPSVDVIVNGALTLTTDANGIGAIEMQPPKGRSNLRLEFRKEGYQTKTLTLNLTKKKEYALGPVELEEIVPQLTVYALKVFEASDERLGIAGTKLIVSIDGTVTTQSTDATGSVTVDMPLDAKQATVTVEHSDPEWFIGADDKQRQVGLEPGKKAYTIEFPFQEVIQRTIPLMFVDRIEKKGVSGVSVRRQGEQRPAATSDDSGTASVSVNRAVGQSVRLHFSGREFYLKDETVVIQKGVDQAPLRVTLDPKLYISGQVVSAGGSVSGVKVVAGGAALGTSDVEGNLKSQTRRYFSTKTKIQVAKPHVLVDSSITRKDAHHYFVSVTFKTEPWDILVKAVDLANQPIGGVGAYVRQAESLRFQPAGETDNDGIIHVEVSDITDTIELRKHGYKTASASAYWPGSVQKKPKTVVLQKREKVKVFLNVLNENGQPIQGVDVYVGVNNPPLSLEAFQGSDYKLDSYPLYISPADLPYHPWKGLMPVEDDDEDGSFAFEVVLFEDVIKKAEAAEKVGQYAAAAEFYKQVSRDDPEHIRAWFKAGQIYGDKLQDYQRATEMFQMIVEEDETYALAHYNMGIYHYSARAYPDAVGAFEAVLTYQKHLGDQYETRMYWARFCLADASYRISKEDGLAAARVQNYRNKARRYCQEFKDNVPDFYAGKAEHQKLVGKINQIAEYIR